MPRPGFGGVSGVFPRVQATISSTCSRLLNDGRASRVVSTAMLTGWESLPLLRTHLREAWFNTNCVEYAKVTAHVNANNIPELDIQCVCYSCRSRLLALVSIVFCLHVSYCAFEPPESRSELYIALSSDPSATPITIFLEFRSPTHATPGKELNTVTLPIY